LVATGLAAGVVMLLLGWTVGRSGDEAGVAPDDSATDVTATTSAGSVPDTVSPDSTLPTVLPSDLPSTTRPPRTTTTTVPPAWTLEPIDVDPRAAALGLRVVAVDGRGRLYDIDATTGERAIIDTDVRPDSGAALYVGSDWILVGAGETGNTQLYRGHATAERVPVGPFYNLRQQPGTDRFWRLEDSFQYPSPMTVSEVTVDGTETGTTFELDPRYWPVGADPRGGLLVLNVPGGTYRVGPDGSSRISTGAVLAIGTDVALVTSCADTLESCGLYAVDRDTGELRPLPSLDESEWVYENAGVFGYTPEMAAVSPDGRWAPIMRTGSSQSFGVIDLDSGEFIELADFPVSGVQWLDGGRAALYLSNGQLTVYVLATGETYAPLGPDRYSLFSVRPDA
jgi:hypothetical protein